MLLFAVDQRCFVYLAVNTWCNLPVITRVTIFQLSSPKLHILFLDGDRDESIFLVPFIRLQRLIVSLEAFTELFLIV